jgi:hypothetical protein
MLPPSPDVQQLETVEYESKGRCFLLAVLDLAVQAQHLNSSTTWAQTFGARRALFYSVKWVSPTQPGTK